MNVFHNWANSLGALTAVVIGLYNALGHGRWKKLLTREQAHQDAQLSQLHVKVRALENGGNEGHGRVSGVGKDKRG